MTKQASIKKIINELRDEIRRHDELYYVQDNPEVSDRDYDELMERLRDLEQKHREFVAPDSPTQRVAGRPAEGFPWPFFGSELLSGRELGEAALDDPTRVEIGRVLARFLRRLHDAEVTYELPADGNRRADMSVRVPKTREQLEELEAAGLWQRPASVDRLLEAAEGLPPSTLSPSCTATSTSGRCSSVTARLRQA